MSLTKKLLFTLLGVLIFTIIMVVLVGHNGLIQQETDHYNETHVEEREEKDNQVIIKQ